MARKTANDDPLAPVTLAVGQEDLLLDRAVQEVVAAARASDADTDVRDLTPDQLQLTDLHLVGNYAVSPHWADGHKTGYYPFRLLRDRCPCAECTQRRAATPVTASPAAAGTHEEHR